MNKSRRKFLQTSTAAAAALTTPYWASTSRTLADEPKSKNDRVGVGVVGNGGIARSDGGAAKKFGDLIAICDVDTAQSAKYNKDICADKAEVYGDYRKLLERKDIDVVLVCTPDHWHTRVAIAAMRAGKDVYCEKPLTLTIDEGHLILKTMQETGRVFQVGTQQRSDDRFQTAVALAHSGRLGKINRVTAAIGTALRGRTFVKTTPPETLNWDMWLGQAPKVEYIKERSHGTFRWWYEYSGGKMTDWGAHHVDIAQWAVAPDLPGPTKFEVLASDHPVPFEKGWPTLDDTYNAAVTFKVRCEFPNGVEMIICDNAEELGFNNGVMIECEKGRYFVNRGKITGEAIDELKENPLPDELFAKLRKGKEKMTHMANFIASCRDRSATISDPASHLRNLNTCHLANIALRLNRPLTWDPIAQKIVGDDEANAFQRREQRAGYEVT